MLFGLSFLLIVGTAVAFVGVQSRGGKLLSVQTGSMVPALQRGDLVAIMGVPKSQIVVGDVVTYINPRNKNQTITHRVVELPSASNYQKFIVKGDANPLPDNPVDPSTVLGKVEFSAPFAGFAVDFVRKPIGLAMLIYIPAIIIVVDEIRRLTRHYQKQRPYLSGISTSREKENGKSKKQKFATAGNITAVLIAVSVILALPVHALMMSQAVLKTNTISATIPTPPPNHCLEGNNTNHTIVDISGSGGGHNVVVVNNSSSQTATSGNASNSSNTNGGSATSGSASNTNCTDINIHIH